MGNKGAMAGANVERQESALSSATVEIQRTPIRYNEIAVCVSVQRRGFSPGVIPSQEYQYKRTVFILLNIKSFPILIIL